MPHRKKTFLLNSLVHGTLLLTLTGFISRVLGFFYRIFLSNTIGAEGMGIYQLIFPIYGLCNALGTASIQTSISRYVASERSKSSSNGAKATLHAGLFLSVSISGLLALFVYFAAAPIAIHFLKEERCIPLLRIMAISLPIGAIHTSINGYYYGMQKASVPAFSQLAEQIIRVFSVFLLVNVSIQNDYQITPTLAVYGLLLGEAASVLYCLMALSLHKTETLHQSCRFPTCRQQMHRILTLAIPLSMNRFMLSLLQSVEAVFIPSKLRSFGLTVTEALEVYGVFSGMALPFILFPSALTNSISVMLLPMVANAQSKKDQRQIDRTSSLGIQCSIFIGILCTGIFLAYGYEMGLLVFHSPAAGSFIRTLAWLCPFLYLSTTVGSILNGLEKTGITFFHNMVALAIRILFVLFCIPEFGILGYLWGLLASQLVIAALHSLSVSKLVHISFSAIDWLVRPAFCIGAAILTSEFCVMRLPVTALPALFLLGLRCLSSILLYLALLWISRDSEKVS